MLVSLIVTTREGRVDRFRRLLSSLNPAVYRFIELIVVSQDCHTVVAPLLEEYRGKLHIQHIRHISCSISTARNIGLRHSTAQILAFPDDDCWYAPDTIIGIIERFTTHPEETFVCTAVFDPLRQLPFGHRRTSKKDVIISVANAFTLPVSTGIFINRALIEGPVVFDERLGTGTAWGSGEETDLILSLLTNGHKGTFLPGITVFHEINYDRPDLFPNRQVFDYSRGFGALIAKSVLERKQYALTWVYTDLLARAVIRFVMEGATLRNHSYLRQFSKAKGMLIGLFEGAHYYAR